MKKVLAFIIIFLIALCPLYVLSIGAAGDFIVDDGVLISFTGLTTTVTIPDDVHYIADGAFKDNTLINKLNLHSGVQAIGNEAFYGCTSLKEVSGGDNVGFVGAYAFYGTPFLENNNSIMLTLGKVVLGGSASGELKIDDGVRMIAPYAFAENTDITSFTAPDSLNTIGEGAFYRCTSLSEVNITDNVSYVGSLAFSGTKFIADYEDEFVVIGNGHLLEYKGNDSSVKVSDNVEHITGGAFYSNTNIMEVTIPEGVSSIGERAFMNCSKLQSVSLPESLLMIDKEAFARCKALKTVTVPEKVELMGESVFYGCNCLENAELKNSADIPKGAFANCTALKYVKLPHNIGSIGNSAFSGCTSLSDLSLSDSINHIGTDAFKSAESLTVSCNKTSFAYSYCAENSINAQQCGDANMDGKVNIRDATYIQKHVASLVKMSEQEILRAECNFDGKLNIRDATYIQKLLAGLL